MNRRSAALGAVLALATTMLAQAATPAEATDTGSGTSSAPRPDRAGAGGTARVVGFTGARNPEVTRSTSVRDAALAHLRRYGALVGVADPGTRLVPGRVTHAVTGDDVVRFSQRRDGLPVIGGAVAVGLSPDRQPTR